MRTIKPASVFPLGIQIKNALSTLLSTGTLSGKRKCAAGLVVLKYLETALQVADMFTKQIFPKHFERLRRVMMGHENFDDMQARYVQVKASGDDMDDPKLYVDSKPGRPPK